MKWRIGIPQLSETKKDVLPTRNENACSFDVFVYFVSITAVGDPKTDVMRLLQGACQTVV
ncbi:hypothetical protein B9K09_10455 [Pseudomonas sp. M30-35]|nr:hypothetical protein B9K09_10455 [Pseudomonas sp. M30-35]